MPGQESSSRPVGSSVRASSMRNRVKSEASVATSEDGTSASAPLSEAAASTTPGQQAEQLQSEQVVQQADEKEDELMPTIPDKAVAGSGGDDQASQLDLTRLPTDPGALLHLLQLGLQCAATSSTLAAPSRGDTSGLVRVRSPSPPTRGPVTSALVAATNNLRPPSSSSSSRWNGAAAGTNPGPGCGSTAAGPQYGLAAWAQAVDHSGKAPSSASSSSSSSSSGAIPQQAEEQQQQQQQQEAPLGQEGSLLPHAMPSLTDLPQQPAPRAAANAAGSAAGLAQLGWTSSAAVSALPQAERRQLVTALLTAAGELLHRDASDSSSNSSSAGLPGSSSTAIPSSSSSSGSSGSSGCLLGKDQLMALLSAAAPTRSADSTGATFPAAKSADASTGWFACTQPSSELTAGGCMVPAGGAGGVRYNAWAPGSPAAAALAHQQPEAVQRQAVLQLSARMRAAVLSDPRTSGSVMVQAHNGSSETSFITGRKVTGSNIQRMKGSALGTGLEGGVAVTGKLHMDSNAPGNSWASTQGPFGGHLGASMADSSSSNISPMTAGTSAGASAGTSSNRFPAAATSIGSDGSYSSRRYSTPERPRRVAPGLDAMASPCQWQTNRGRSPGRYSSNNSSSSSSGGGGGSNAQHVRGSSSKIDDILGHLKPSHRANSSSSTALGHNQRPQQLLRQLQQQQQQQQQQRGVQHQPWQAARRHTPRGTDADGSWSPGRGTKAGAAVPWGGFRTPAASPARSATASGREVAAGAWGGPNTPSGSPGSLTWALRPRPASAAAGSSKHRAGAVGCAVSPDRQQYAAAGAPGVNISQPAAHGSRSPRRRGGSPSPDARSSSPHWARSFMGAAAGGGGSSSSGHGNSRQRAKSAPAMPRGSAGRGSTAASGAGSRAATVWDVNRDTLVFNMYNIRGAEEEEDEQDDTRRSPRHGKRYASPEPPAAADLFSLRGRNASNEGGYGMRDSSSSRNARPATTAAAAAGAGNGLLEGGLSAGFTQWGQLEAGLGQQLQLQLSPLQWQDVAPPQRQQSPGKRYSSGSTGVGSGARPATPSAAAAVTATGWFATPPPPRTLAPRWEAAASAFPGHQSKQLSPAGLTGLTSAGKVPGLPRRPGTGPTAAVLGRDGASPVTRILAMRSLSPELVTEKWRQQTLHQPQQPSVQQVPLAWTSLSPDRSAATRLPMFEPSAALTGRPWAPGTLLATGARPTAAAGTGGWSLAASSSLFTTAAARGGGGGWLQDSTRAMQRSAMSSPDGLLRSLAAGSPAAAAGGALPGVFDLLRPSDQSLHAANMVSRPRSVGGLTVGSLPYNSLLSPSLVSPKHRVTPLASTGTSPPGTPLLGASRVTPGPAAAAAAAARDDWDVRQHGAYEQSRNSTPQHGAEGVPGDSGDDPGDWDPVGQLLAASPFAAAAHAGMDMPAAGASSQQYTPAASARVTAAAYQPTRSQTAARSQPEPPQQQQKQQQQYIEQSLMNQLPSPGWAASASGRQLDESPSSSKRLGVSSGAYTTAASAAAAGMHWFGGDAPSTSTLVAARKEAAHTATVKLASSLRATQRAQQQQPIPQQQQQQQPMPQQQQWAYNELLEPADLDSDSDADHGRPQHHPYQQQGQRQQPVTAAAMELVTGVPGMWRRSQSGSFEFTDGPYDSWGQVPGSPAGGAAATMPARSAAGAAGRASKAAMTMPGQAGGVGVSGDKQKLSHSFSSGKSAASAAVNQVKKRAPAGASAVAAGHTSLRGSGREYM